VGPTANTKRWTLITCVLGSSIVLLDATIVHVALPAVERDVGGGLATQQWVVSAYALALGAFMLLGGSLGDVLGERRVFLAGVAGFGATSLACAAAPSAEALIAARALQGVAGALLTPAALAVIIATFSPDERGRAIGSWTAWTGVATLAGPLLGGQLVESAGWRWIFIANVPLVAITWLLVSHHVPASAARRERHVDAVGAMAAALALGGAVFALIEQPQRGWSSPVVLIALAVGAVALVALVVREHTARDPMLPPGLLRRHNFLVGNVETVGVYAVFAALLFLLAVFLQQVGGWTATQAGLATLPTTVLLTVLSRPFGALADRLGPRLFMGAGPLVMAVGLVLLVRVERDVDFAGALLPALVTFSVGLAMTVAPLTAMVLAGVEEHQAGIASAVNNAVARIAGLAGIAVLGPLLGTQLDVEAFHVGALAAAGLVAAAGVVGAVLVRNPQRVVRAAECSGGPLAGAPRDAAVRDPQRSDQGVGQGPHGREPLTGRAMVGAR
jgi:EmrB/QacA subfamily drug resistance transporter